MGKGTDWSVRKVNSFLEKEFIWRHGSEINKPGSLKGSLRVQRYFRYDR